MIATQMLNNNAAATLYCASRKDDTEALAKALPNVKYAEVFKLGGHWFVDGNICDSFACMLAYILKRYW